MPIEASVLVPITEDIQVGDGQPHPPHRWLWLQDQFEAAFKGWTLAPGRYYGLWIDPSGFQCVDRSRKYIVDSEPGKIQRLRRLSIDIGLRFRQRVIRLVVRGQVMYVSSGLQ